VMHFSHPRAIHQIYSNMSISEQRLVLDSHIMRQLA
jgi:hypothetical protein